jgi:NAD(P)-dependent dehydrogenase (short-subunit alcohol dehydrogenase family)
MNPVPMATDPSTTPVPRTAVVAGGARGCGRAVALALARAGADIAVCDLGDYPYQSLDYRTASGDDLETTAALVRAVGRRAMTVTVDVRDHAAVSSVPDLVEAELGPVTDLVVTAGVVSVVPLTAMTRGDWDEVLDTNLTGAFNVMQAVVSRMRPRGVGRAVLVCGQEGRRGAHSLSHVSAAGWALIGMAKSIALEVAASGVTINVVAAGPIGSPQLLDGISYQRILAGPAEATATGPAVERIAAVMPQSRPYLQPEEVADAVVFLMSRQARSITGAVLDVSLGLAGRNSA